jgi:hypothetical protein
MNQQGKQSRRNFLFLCAIRSKQSAELWIDTQKLIWDKALLVSLFLDVMRMHLLAFGFYLNLHFLAVGSAGNPVLDMLTYWYEMAGLHSSGLRRWLDRMRLDKTRLQL